MIYIAIRYLNVIEMLAVLWSLEISSHTDESKLLLADETLAKACAALIEFSKIKETYVVRIDEIEIISAIWTC